MNPKWLDLYDDLINDKSAALPYERHFSCLISMSRDGFVPRHDGSGLWVNLNLREALLKRKQIPFDDQRGFVYIGDSL